jgi:AcrR family transcriptional regulator
MRVTSPTGNPGRPVASIDRDARELLLSAATELFASQGVAATTFATIAKRAGLTPAMLHYYFKDRDQLLDAVVEERLGPLIEEVWAPVKPGMEPAELIRGIVARVLDGVERMPWVPSTWMREVLNEGGLLRSRMLQRLPHEKLRIVSKAIARGQAGKTANPDLDPQMTVFSTLGLVMLHMATAKVWAEIFHREPLSREAIGRHITGLLIEGVHHHGSPARPRPRRRTRKRTTGKPR